MERVAIVGCSGGGKSSLARALGARIGAPVIHMDTLFWKPGWVESDPEPFRHVVDVAAETERWVMDGSFTSASARRFARADTVIWIEQPRLVCLRRAILRSLFSFGRPRADLAPGCPEKFDLAFYRYIWNYDRTTRPKVARALDEHAPNARRIHLRSDKEIADFLAAV